MLDIPLHFAAADGITTLFKTFGIDAKIIFAQMLNFLIVATLLWKLAYKPVIATLDERQKKISDGLQYAEEMKAKLADAEKQHAEMLKRASHEAQQLVAEARDSAKANAEKIIQDASHKAEQMVKKGEEAIALEHAQMLNDLRKEVTRLVVQTSGKVLAKDLSDEEKSRFSESATKELYSLN
jgi:F-type H+-transporting ATPase subunit b